MFKTCQSCGQELAYRDNDNPLLNCVELCEFSQCKLPYREEYYEQPADVSLFRATELWEECLIDAANELGIKERFNQIEFNGDLLKNADALYLKRC